MKRRPPAAEPPGQDSFLDVVANLVGILIILVVVIGAHAGQSWSDDAAAEALEEEVVAAQQATQRATDEASNRERHNLEVEARIEQEAAMAELRDAERDHWLREIQLARQTLNETLAAEDATRQQAVELARDRVALEQQLQKVRRQRRVLAAEDAGPQKLDHLPTPIAKTVFTNEIHFRLKNRRLAHVPLEDLVDEMRDEWRVKADNLKFADETVETVGPIEGFRMQYKLALVSKTVSTPSGMLRQEGPEFVGFVLLPLSDDLGTPLEEALQPESWFDRRLKRSDPEETTVTVWVYPDSYGDFGKLKGWLYDRGFLTAGWPLADGMPIAGGPNGYRSTAQ